MLKCRCKHANLSCLGRLTCACVRVAVYRICGPGRGLVVPQYSARSSCSVRLANGRAWSQRLQPGWVPRQPPGTQPQPLAQLSPALFACPISVSIIAIRIIIVRAGPLILHSFACGRKLDLGTPDSFTVGRLCRRSESCNCVWRELQADISRE